MALSPDAVHAYLAQDLKAYWREHYQAYIEQRDPAPSHSFLNQRQSLADMMTEAHALPQSVCDAYRYYAEHVMDQDWGSVAIATLRIQNDWVYVVHVDTDGDDGWLEVFDEQGHSLGTGRTYLELIAWGDTATLREQVNTGEFPPELDQSQTLWGKPLPPKGES
ncbi:hypothetical protein ACQ4M4_20470 [Leptolyngbya sp. AN02str]|uniref:hypothetical protein n=1 Tax=Leptolyngbya sp. AN02str TaxID=3423363 RepID=UPI003D31B784